MPAKLNSDFFCRIKNCDAVIWRQQTHINMLVALRKATIIEIIYKVHIIIPESVYNGHVVGRYVH